MNLDNRTESVSYFVTSLQRSTIKDLRRRYRLLVYVDLKKLGRGDVL